MFYEIRNYHFNPELLDAYKTWARTEALPYMSGQLDLVGFWANTDAAPEVGGETLDPLGSANLTWIIRWESAAARDETWAHIKADPAWQAIFSRVPGGTASYLRVEAKFAESLV